MAITLTELQEKLKGIDEISLMEVLEITSEDIVQRFVDRIEDNYEDLVEEFDEEEQKDFYIPWSDEDEENEEDVYESNLDLYDNE